MTAERDPMTLNESSVPDPEVVAKPKWRQFTAQYRLRILEEAERCTEPYASADLVRQANWQKVGGESPLERRTNQPRFSASRASGTVRGQAKRR